MSIVIGTRCSKLAVIQAENVKLLLKEIGIESRIKKIKTTGDIINKKPLRDIGGKNLFAKEIHKSLINKEIDIAVHCLKDLDSVKKDDFSYLAYLKREDPRDMFISKSYKSISQMPSGSIVGTCSPRRESFVKKINPDIIIKSLRGNVPSRIERLKLGEFDAIILACSGLNRLNIVDHEICTPIEIDEITPCGGQGVIVIECLKEREDELFNIRKINDNISQLTSEIEKSFLIGLNGDCHTPVGVFCNILSDDNVSIKCSYFNDDKYNYFSKTWPLKKAKYYAKKLGEEWSLY